MLLWHCYIRHCYTVEVSDDNSLRLADIHKYLRLSLKTDIAAYFNSSNTKYTLNCHPIGSN